jgi:hypothetical protein
VLILEPRIGIDHRVPSFHLLVMVNSSDEPAESKGIETLFPYLHQSVPSDEWHRFFLLSVTFYFLI